MTIPVRGCYLSPFLLNSRFLFLSQDLCSGDLDALTNLVQVLALGDFALTKLNKLLLLIGSTKAGPFAIFQTFENLFIKLVDIEFMVVLGFLSCGGGC